MDEHGQRAAPGAVGELVVRGPHVMKGYWNRPEATAKVLRPGPRRARACSTPAICSPTDEAGFLYFVEPQGRHDQDARRKGRSASG